MFIMRVARVALAILYLFLAAGCADRDGHHEHREAGADHDAATNSHESEHQSPDHTSATGEDHDDEDHDDEVRQAGTPLHGEANLAIAVDGNKMVIEFESPVYNLTGFEHAPQSSEERAVVEEVEAILADASKLFAVNGEAGCQAGSPPTRVSLALTEEHGNDDGHDGDHHDDHESELAHEESHNDVLIEYQFRCSAPDAISEIGVLLFELFPRFEELDVVFLDQNRQSSATLSPRKSSLKLDQ